MCGIWFYTQLINKHNHDDLQKASNEIMKRGPDRTIRKYFTFGNFVNYLLKHYL